MNIINYIVKSILNYRYYGVLAFSTSLLIINRVYFTSLVYQLIGSYSIVAVMLATTAYLVNNVMIKQDTEGNDYKEFLIVDAEDDYCVTKFPLKSNGVFWVYLNNEIINDILIIKYVHKDKYIVSRFIFTCVNEPDVTPLHNEMINGYLTFSNQFCRAFSENGIVAMKIIPVI